MFHEHAPGIYSVENDFVEGRDGVVIGSRGALLIDVGFTADIGVATAAFVQEHGHTPNRVLLTHGHSDHVLGGAALKGAEVFAHQSTRAEIRRHLAKYSQHKAVPYDDLLTQALFPTITFSEKLEIDLGDKQVQVFPTPGHSADHVSALVLPERVLFAGDTLVTGIVPAIGDGDSRTLETTLEAMRELEAEIIVVGHGPALVGQAAIQAHIGWTLDYLNAIRDRLQAALAGGTAPSREEVTVLLPYHEFVGDRLPPERHDMARRHIDTAMKILAEELAAQSLAVAS